MKKAQVESFAVGLIILLASLLIGFFIVRFFSENADNKIEESNCAKSVLSHIQMLEISKLTGKTNELKIDCPRINVTIKTSDEEKIKQEIAEKMRVCWQNWQKGEEELFYNQGIYCQPCYLVDFKHKDLEVKDFDKYLMETKIPLRNYTYMQYFSGSTNDVEFSKEKLAQNPGLLAQTTSFKTDGTKMVLFYYVKDRNEIKELVNEVASIGTGVTIGAGTGAVILGAAGGAICGFFTLGTGSIACAVGGAKIGAIVGGAAGGFVAGVMAQDAYPQWISFILFKDYSEQELVNLGCEIAPATQTNLYPNNP